MKLDLVNTNAATHEFSKCLTSLLVKVDAACDVSALEHPSSASPERTLA